MIPNVRTVLRDCCLPQTSYYRKRSAASSSSGFPKGYLLPPLVPQEANPPYFSFSSSCQLSSFSFLSCSFFVLRFPFLSAARLQATGVCFFSFSCCFLGHRYCLLKASFDPHPTISSFSSISFSWSSFSFPVLLLFEVLHQGL